MGEWGQGPEALLMVMAVGRLDHWSLGHTRPSHLLEVWLYRSHRTPIFTLNNVGLCRPPEMDQGGAAPTHSGTDKPADTKGLSSMGAARVCGRPRDHTLRLRAGPEMW